MTKKKYALTEQDKEQFKPCADKWIANAMSTDPMTELDRDICRQAAKDLYHGAALGVRCERRR